MNNYKTAKPFDFLQSKISKTSDKKRTRQTLSSFSRSRSSLLTSTSAPATCLDEVDL